MIEYSQVNKKKIKKISDYFCNQLSEQNKEKDRELPSLWVRRNAFLTRMLAEFRRKYLCFNLSKGKFKGHYKNLINIYFSLDPKGIENLISELDKILQDFDEDFFIHSVFEYILEPSYKIPEDNDNIDALIQFSLIYYTYIADRVPWVITEKMDFLVMKVIYHMMEKTRTIDKTGQDIDRTQLSTQRKRAKLETEQIPKILKAWNEYIKKSGSNLKNISLHQISRNIAETSGYSINTVKKVIKNLYPPPSTPPWKISSKRNVLVKKII